MDPDDWITDKDEEITQAAADSHMWPLTADYLATEASDSASGAPLVPEYDLCSTDSTHQLHEATDLSLDTLPNSWVDDNAEWGHLLLPEMEACMHSPPLTRNGDSTLNLSVTNDASESRRLSLDTMPTAMDISTSGNSLTVHCYNSSAIISLLSQLNARIASMQCVMDKVVQAADASAVTERMTSSSGSGNVKDFVEGNNTAGNSRRRRPTRLLDDTALGSAAIWLMRQKNRRSAFFHRRSDDYYIDSDAQLRSSILQDIFSASNHFLEVLDECVARHCCTTPPSTPHATRDPLNETIRHLIISCHLLLMGIYETLLVVLEHDALLGKHMASAANHQGPLGQIQLASVVQLLSYIFARQKDAIKAYLCEAQQQRLGHCRARGCSHATLNIDKQVRSGLIHELEKRFQRLECILGLSSCM